MAFLDDFGNMFAEGGQNTIKRGKDTLEVSKLNSSINDIGRQMEGIYFHIGKLYAQKHGEKKDYDPEFQDAFAALENYQKQINEIQEQIQQIQSVHYCSQCGAQLNAGAVFCASCGKKLA